MSWRASALSNGDMIDQMKGYGLIKSAIVEKVMRSLDRGRYSAEPSIAYVDRPHGIGHGQTISAPHMHAMCFELLKNYAKEGSRVLDVGSGSGYFAAGLALMVGKEGRAIGIDRISQLVSWSIKNVKNDHPELLEQGSLILKVADGWKGCEEHAPYDAIHVGAAAATVPDMLVKCLKPGGRMVIPVGTAEQHLIRIDKSEDGSISQTVITGVRYVPLVKGDER